jgi:hypothetical protein
MIAIEEPPTIVSGPDMDGDYTPNYLMPSPRTLKMMF